MHPERPPVCPNRALDSYRWKERGNHTHSDIFLLAEEAHPNVVPQGRAFRHAADHCPVFGEGNIIISMGLHHAASCQCSLQEKGRETIWGHALPQAQEARDKAPKLKSSQEELSHTFPSGCCWDQQCGALGSLSTKWSQGKEGLRPTSCLLLLNHNCLRNTTVWEVLRVCSGVQGTSRAWVCEKIYALHFVSPTSTGRNSSGVT